MQNEPINQYNWPEAVSLLCEGFPETDDAFWNGGLARWSHLVEDAFTGPFGFIARDKQGVPQGVLLTFRAPIAWGKDRERVNFSSWYVRDKYRIFAPIMLKRLSAEANATYTDFTPNDAVQQMLHRHNYKELVYRHVGFLTPFQALREGAAVLEMNETLSKLGHDPALVQALKDHHKLGCLIFGIQTPSGVSAIVLRQKTRKRIIRCAEIIYIQNLDHLFHALPGLARKLLKSGVLIIESGIPETWSRSQISYDWGTTARFVKGSWPQNQIDYLYSEIPVLGV